MRSSPPRGTSWSPSQPGAARDATSSRPTSRPHAHLGRPIGGDIGTRPGTAGTTPRQPGNRTPPRREARPTIGTCRAAPAPSSVRPATDGCDGTTQRRHAPLFASPPRVRAAFGSSSSPVGRGSHAVNGRDLSRREGRDTSGRRSPPKPPPERLLLVIGVTEPIADPNGRRLTAHDPPRHVPTSSSHAPVATHREASARSTLPVASSTLPVASYMGTLFETLTTIGSGAFGTAVLVRVRRPVYTASQGEPNNISNAEAERRTVDALRRRLPPLLVVKRLGTRLPPVNASPPPAGFAVGGSPPPHHYHTQQQGRPNNHVIPQSPGSFVAKPLSIALSTSPSSSHAHHCDHQRLNPEVPGRSPCHVGHNHRAGTSLSPPSHSRYAAALNEVRALQNLRHAHIVTFYHAWAERKDGHLHLAMEYCPGGDAGKFLKRYHACLLHEALHRRQPNSRERGGDPLSHDGGVFLPPAVGRSTAAAHGPGGSFPLLPQRAAGGDRKDEDGDVRSRQPGAPPTGGHTAGSSSDPLASSRSSTTSSNWRHQPGAGVSFLDTLVRRWAVQLLLALEHMHRRRMIHRDIKLQNIFLTDESGFTAKLGDFGLSKLLASQDDDAATTQAGTPYYFSPEIALGVSHSRKTDIWSLGVALYFAVAGVYPFAGKSLFAVLAAIRESTPPPLSSLVAVVPSTITDRSWLSESQRPMTEPLSTTIRPKLPKTGSTPNVDPEALKGSSFTKPPSGEAGREGIDGGQSIAAGGTTRRHPSTAWRHSTPPPLVADSPHPTNRRSSLRQPDRHDPHSIVVSQELVELIHAMLTKDPERRPSARGLLDLPWVACVVEQMRQYSAAVSTRQSSSAASPLHSDPERAAPHRHEHTMLTPGSEPRRLFVRRAPLQLPRPKGGDADAGGAAPWTTRPMFVNVRARPALDAPLVGRLSAGDGVFVVGYIAPVAPAATGWFHIRSGADGDEAAGCLVGYCIESFEGQRLFEDLSTSRRDRRG